MKEKAYYETINVKNEVKLRKLLETLPPFCKQFFIGIEATSSSRTKIAYAYDIGCFFDYLHATNPVCAKMDITDFPISILNEITPMDIEEYLSYLKYYEKDGTEHTNDEGGLKRKLSALRSFYHYYYKNGLIEDDPTVKVDMPKIHEKNIIRLDVDEVAKLLDEVESGENLTARQQQYHEKTKIRDLAMMTLLLGTGIRVSECVGLDMEDVDFKNNGIKIHRKGGAEVVVYFGEEVRRALMDYMVERQKITAADGSINALFLSLQNKRISVRSVENMVKKYSKLVTTLKHITPHKLRSTYGTSLYRETGDIYLVADVLGHKDVNTTRKHYAALEDERRRSAAKYVKLRDAFPGRFTFTADRDYFDYVYLRSDLATLRGKKYQPKRNHINRFKAAYPNYEYKELTAELVPECLRLESMWCKANDCAENEALIAERRSMTDALKHINELDLRGGVLHVNGEIVAFTFGAPINNETFDTCVEKANTDIEGAYAMINNEFANRIPEQYIYINREEDLGLEGLRKAKLSYYPETLLEKYIVELQ